MAWLVVSALAYMLLVGDSATVDWVAAAIIAAVVAALSVPLTVGGAFRLRFHSAWARALPSVAVQIFVDFWIVTRSLLRAMVRRQREVGHFVARSEFPAGGDDDAGRTWRAFVIVAATLSPNSYVVDVDPERRTRLAHDLVPNRASEQPA